MEKHKDDPKAAAFLCNQLLEEFRTAVFRQTMFAAFEKEAHAMYEKGEPLTAENLSSMYYALNEKYYGAGCKVDELISCEWMRIPHFYRNFYVYQYATGFSAAVAIAQNILKNGAPAVAKYKEFLSGGCSQSPVDLLKIAGVDLETPRPIQDALDVFGEILEEMKQLS
jgi:oligoendopeptidase F